MTNGGKHGAFHGACLGVWHIWEEFGVVHAYMLEGCVRIGLDRRMCIVGTWNHSHCTPLRLIKSVFSPTQPWLEGKQESLHRGVQGNPWTHSSTFKNPGGFKTNLFVEVCAYAVSAFLSAFVFHLCLIQPICDLVTLLDNQRASHLLGLVEPNLRVVKCSRRILVTRENSADT